MTLGRRIVPAPHQGVFLAEVLLRMLTKHAERTRQLGISGSQQRRNGLNKVAMRRVHAGISHLVLRLPGQARLDLHQHSKSLYNGSVTTAR